jgi:hypothetical protein
MDGSSQYNFELKELLIILIKNQGLHEGIWSLGFEFGMGAGNIGPNPEEARPSAFIQVKQLALARATVEGPLALDAAKVNPLTKTKGKSSAKAKG